jgi:cytosine/adenosine deaminase-related metal-dependent hydrolase
VTALATADVLNAATVGGARILGRDDIGRLAKGCRADLVLVDARHPAMQPLRDPLRSLVYAAAERAVRDVYVAGRQVVADGKVLTLDHQGAALRVTEAQRRAELRVPGLDYAKRPAAELVPLSLPPASQT